MEIEKFDEVYCVVIYVDKLLIVIVNWSVEKNDILFDWREYLINNGKYD